VLDPTCTFILRSGKFVITTDLCGCPGEGNCIFICRCQDVVAVITAFEEPLIISSPRNGGTQVSNAFDNSLHLCPIREHSLQGTSMKVKSSLLYKGKKQQILDNLDLCLSMSNSLVGYECTPVLPAPAAVHG